MVWNIITAAGKFTASQQVTFKQKDAAGKKEKGVISSFLAPSGLVATGSMLGYSVLSVIQFEEKITFAEESGINSSVLFRMQIQTFWSKRKKLKISPSEVSELIIYLQYFQ